MKKIRIKKGQTSNHYPFFIVGLESLKCVNCDTASRTLCLQYENRRDVRVLKFNSINTMWDGVAALASARKKLGKDKGEFKYQFTYWNTGT